MASLTRRRFLGATAAAATLGVTPGKLSASVRDATGSADLIVTGATVHTMDPNNPLATALAVSGQHILAVGSDDDVSNLMGSNTKIIDARGQTVLPGFIDAHSHPLLAEDAISVNVNLPRISDVQAALAAQASLTPIGQWVQGTMYDDTKFEEGRALTRQDIDAVVPDHPVMVRHRGGHTAVVNSRALNLAEITPTTADPVGGRY